MEGIGLLVVLFMFIFAAGIGSEKKARQKRMEDAYDFNPENAQYGGAVSVSNEALGKAGCSKARAFRLAILRAVAAPCTIRASVIF